MEKKSKCLKCGYSLFFEKREAEIECPKCLQKWRIVKDEDEVFLEPAENLANQSFL